MVPKKTYSANITSLSSISVKPGAAKDFRGLLPISVEHEFLSRTSVFLK